MLLMWLVEVLHSVIGPLRLATALVILAMLVASCLTIGGAAWWCASLGLLLATAAWASFTAPPELRDLALRLLKYLSIGLREALR